MCSKDCGDWRMSEEVRLVANTSASGSWAEILVARERAISVASRVRILGEFMVSSRVVVSVGSDLSDACLGCVCGSLRPELLLLYPRNLRRRSASKGGFQVRVFPVGRWLSLSLSRSPFSLHPLPPLPLDPADRSSLSLSLLRFHSLSRLHGIVWRNCKGGKESSFAMYLPRLLFTRRCLSFLSPDTRCLPFPSSLA